MLAFQNIKIIFGFTIILFTLYSCHSPVEQKVQLFSAWPIFFIEVERLKILDMSKFENSMFCEGTGSILKQMVDEVS